MFGEEGRGCRREKFRRCGMHAGFELVSEVLDGRGDRAGGTVAKRAECAPQNVVAHVEQQLDVARMPLALVEAFERLCEPPCALAARRALATGLVLVELRPTQHATNAGCGLVAVSYTHLRAHETVLDLVCRL